MPNPMLHFSYTTSCALLPEQHFHILFCAPPPPSPGWPGRARQSTTCGAYICTPLLFGVRTLSSVASVVEDRRGLRDRLRRLGETGANSHSAAAVAPAAHKANEPTKPKRRSFTLKMTVCRDLHCFCRDLPPWKFRSQLRASYDMRLIWRSFRPRTTTPRYKLQAASPSFVVL